MAAKIAGCDPIVAVDVHDWRACARPRARRHPYDRPQGLRRRGRRDPQDQRRRRALCAGNLGGAGGVSRGHRVPDAGGHLRAARQRAARAAKFRSKCRSCSKAASVRGVVQGDSVPQEFIPKLVDLIMAGKFPIERMIKFYDFADINLAAQESSTGIAIKPVLRMRCVRSDRRPEPLPAGRRRPPANSRARARGAAWCRSSR